MTGSENATFGFATLGLSTEGLGMLRCLNTFVAAQLCLSTSQMVIEHPGPNRHSIVLLDGLDTQRQAVNALELRVGRLASQ